MHSRLQEILKKKQEEIETLRRHGLPRPKDNPIPPIRNFKAAISVPNRINLIAEVKFASPSAGLIREEGDPLPIAEQYDRAGAAAVSVLTDGTFFKGDLNHLDRVRRGISLPVLRKDFVLDEIQVRESSLWGADAILLIARILSAGQLESLLDTCKQSGMGALTEVHDKDDLEKALGCGAEIIGINNRDLDTFQVHLDTTLKLAPLVPRGHVIISESGINTERDIHYLGKSGIHAVLVGSSIMGSDDVTKKVEGLVKAGRIAGG
jgi:indole-3-glycerol phosphate synthase